MAKGRLYDPGAGDLYDGKGNDTILPSGFDIEDGEGIDTVIFGSDQASLPVTIDLLGNTIY